MNRNFFLGLLVSASSSLCALGGQVEIIPVATRLTPTAPEWKIVQRENYETGAPKLIYFYEENEKGEEKVVHKISFFPNGQVEEEVDLIEIGNDEKIS